MDKPIAKKATTKAKAKAKVEVKAVIRSRKRTFYDKLGAEERTMLDKKVTGNKAALRRTRESVRLLKPDTNLCEIFHAPPSLRSTGKGTLAELIEKAIGSEKVDPSPQGLMLMKDIFYKLYDDAGKLYNDRQYLTLITSPKRRRSYSTAESLALYNQYHGEVWLDEEDTYVKKGWRVAVKMGPVTLRNLKFGSFIVGLPISTSNGYTKGAYVKAYPIKALWAASNNAVEERSLCHPHIKDYVLCLGEVHNQVMENFAGGRVMDAFSLIELVVMSYSAEGAYKRLSKWEEGHKRAKCTNCKEMVREDALLRCSGKNCDVRVCRQCSDGQSCHHCGRIFCDKHRPSCLLCGENACNTCECRRRGRTKAGDRIVCGTCWAKLKNSLREHIAYGDVDTLIVLGYIRDEWAKSIVSLQAKVGNIGNQIEIGSKSKDITTQDIF